MALLLTLSLVSPLVIRIPLSFNHNCVTVLIRFETTSLTTSAFFVNKVIYLLATIPFLLFNISGRSKLHLGQVLLFKLCICLPIMDTFLAYTPLRWQFLQNVLPPINRNWQSCSILTFKQYRQKCPSLDIELGITGLLFLCSAYWAIITDLLVWDYKGYITAIPYWFWLSLVKFRLA